MAASIDRLIKVLCRLCGLLAALVLVVLAGLVVVSIASRAMGIYVPGLTDYAAYCLAWAGALGMTYTFGEHGHIRVEMLVDSLGGKLRYGLEVGVLGLAAAVVSYLAFYLTRMTWTSYEFQDRSDGSDEILIWIPQAPFAAGFILFAAVLVLAFARAILRGDLEGLAATKQAESWE